MNLIYVFITILLTVYGQIVIKWQVAQTQILFANETKWQLIIKLLLNLWVLSGFAAAFLAAVSWMLAVSKLPLSYAYPFVSLSFVFIFLASVWLFNEPVTWNKVLGVTVIVLGVVITSI